MKKLLLCLTLLCLIGCQSSKKEDKIEEKKEDIQTETKVETDIGPLHVEGTQLMNSAGEKVQLKGISTHGLSWFPDYVNQECFKELHGWGANVVRLAMYTAESGGYCSDGDQDQLKDLIDKGVQYATKSNMYVIIDWHILSDNNPHMHIEEAKDFFKEMSKKYADHTNVIYEICNEPNGSTSWDDIREYANVIIPIIRENDKDSIILVGTPQWSQLVEQAAAHPLDQYENIMYTLHFYAATHKDDLRQSMKKAIQQGLPIFVSEYGICDASGNGAIDEDQANAWVETMNDLNVSYIAWNLSNKNETSAIFNSDCQKISGFTENDLSESGQWVYQMLSGKQVKKEEDPTSQDPLSVKASLQNSWETNGEKYYQYNVVIKNNQKDVNGWTVQMTLDNDFEISDSWNGKYTKKGKTLIIKPVDYNQSISAKQQLSDIGFIIKSKSSLEMKAISVD